MNNILIADSDPIMLRALTGLLTGSTGFVTPLTALDNETALRLVEHHDIKLAVIAIREPHFEGFELFTRLNRDHPAIKVIVLGGETRSGDWYKLKLFTSPSIIFDRTTDFSMLPKRILTELNIDHGGRVSGINLAAFLQMLAMENRSAAIQVQAKHSTGLLWLENGELTSARTGQMRGREAALEIIPWKSVTLDIDYAGRPENHEIDTPLLTLLMESGRADDEKTHARASNQRLHERHEFRMALDYTVGSMNHHCFLRDISESGAYIESDQQLGIGQDLTVKLATPGIQGDCSIDAVVSRVDAKGAGISFKPTSNFQQKLIEAIIDSSSGVESAQSDSVYPAG